MRITNVDKLYHPIASEAAMIDWEDQTGEDGTPTWEFWEYSPAEIRGVQRTLVYESSSAEWFLFTKDGSYEEADEQEVKPEPVEGPMMNYYWPLGTMLPKGDPIRAAWSLRGLNTCLVRVGDTYGIALTGGGMDLSWHLAASAVQVGFLPWLGLSLSQGSPEESWRYGVSEIGSPLARRVRAALRRHVRSEKVRLARLSRDIDRWG